ncbi:MAG: hypothetical protein ACE14L_12770 [Terriglobales bacterium]
MPCTNSALRLPAGAATGPGMSTQFPFIVSQGSGVSPGGTRANFRVRHRLDRTKPL